jgi:hypothetical protein
MSMWGSNMALAQHLLWCAILLLLSSFLPCTPIHHMGLLKVFRGLV